VKKIILFGSTFAILSLLTIVFTLSLLADGPDEGKGAPVDQETSEVTPEVCEVGDSEG
jgi:hypothetical protein